MFTVKPAKSRGGVGPHGTDFFKRAYNLDYPVKVVEILFR